MMHVHVTVKIVNMPFNNDHTLIFFKCICWKDTLYKSCRKNFQVSIVISKVFWKRYNFYVSRKEYSVHTRLLVYSQVVQDHNEGEVGNHACI